MEGKIKLDAYVVKWSFLTILPSTPLCTSGLRKITIEPSWFLFTICQTKHQRSQAHLQILQNYFQRVISNCQSLNVLTATRSHHFQNHPDQHHFVSNLTQRYPRPFARKPSKRFSKIQRFSSCGHLIKHLAGYVSLQCYTLLSNGSKPKPTFSGDHQLPLAPLHQAWYMLWLG